MLDAATSSAGPEPFGHYTDAAEGLPDAAPLKAPEPPAGPKKRGFTSEQARAAAAKRKTKGRPKASAPAADGSPAPAASGKRKLSKPDAVRAALVMTAQATGDARYLAVAATHADQIAQALEELAEAFDWKLEVDPRVAAGISASLVAVQCWQTFAAAPKELPKPAEATAPTPPTEAHG